MRLLSSAIIIFLFCLSFSSAALLYTPDVMVTVDNYTVTNRLSGENTHDGFVYEIAPTNYKIVTVTLSGPSGLLPKLYLYDPVAESFVFQENGLAGDVVTYTYTNGMLGDKPQSMYAVVADYPGATDQSFTLTVVAQEQNDIGSGTDAPKRFREGLMISPDTYQGHLGGGDTIDYYSLDVQEDETVSFTVIPNDKTSLHFTLIDSSGFTKVDTRSMLEDENLKAQYLSLKDQRVYFGIEGNLPYTLIIESNKQQDSDDGIADVPKPIIVIPEPEQNPPVTSDEEDEAEPSLGLFFMIVAVLVLIMLGVGLLLRSKHVERKVKSKVEKDENPVEKSSEKPKKDEKHEKK